MGATSITAVYLAPELLHLVK